MCCDLSVRPFRLRFRASNAQNPPLECFQAEQDRPFPGFGADVRTGPYSPRIGPDSACFRGSPLFVGAGTRFESHLGHSVSAGQRPNGPLTVDKSSFMGPFWWPWPGCTSFLGRAAVLGYLHLRGVLTAGLHDVCWSSGRRRWTAGFSFVRHRHEDTGGRSDPVTARQRGTLEGTFSKHGAGLAWKTWTIERKYANS